MITLEHIEQARGEAMARGWPEVVEANGIEWGAVMQAASDYAAAKAPTEDPFRLQAIGFLVGFVIALQVVAEPRS